MDGSTTSINQHQLHQFPVQFETIYSIPFLMELIPNSG
jgi:hypothetical protein